jgi:signal transduction histidine kinase
MDLNPKTFIRDTNIADYDDSNELHKLIDDKIEASIICRNNQHIPNFLSVIYANSLFYMMFNLDESKVIGKNYDFIFEDIDLGNFSEDQAEYSRLIKSVQHKSECSVIINCSSKNGKYKNFKLHITYHPHLVRNGIVNLDYAIFSFIKIDVINNDDETNKIKSKGNILLLRSLERTLRSERTMREIANLIISDSKIDFLAKSIAKILCEHLKCDRCIIHDFKKNKADFVIEHSNSFAKKMIPDKPTDGDIKKIQNYINFQNDFYKKFGSNDKKSSIAIVQDVLNDENFLSIKEVCMENNINSQIAITTTFNGTVNGGIYLHQSENRVWMQDEIDLIEIVSEQFSIALDRDNSIQKVMITNHALMEKTILLKDSLKKEQEMRKMQNEFVALVSHEFKTPLQIIDGNRELISRKLKNFNNVIDNIVFGYLDKIKSGIQRMNGLIESTLHLAKMENSDAKIKVEINNVNLYKLLEDIIDKNIALANQKNIIILKKIDDLPKEYLTDPKLLDHAISNIVSNAIKYSKINSNIKIIGKVLKDCIAIRIIDNGIGIPNKDLNNIGKKFYRATNAISVAGTGIGIYLTKHFIDLLEGKLIIDSKENFGTTITIILKNDFFDENIQ